jgi:hypothetical protein
MVASSVALEAPAPAAYRPGAVSGFLTWVDRLPWHGWWLPPALVVVLLAWSQAVLWATGQLPIGTIQPLTASGAVYGPYTLAILVYINRWSERALAAFWPATGWPDDRREAWRYELTTSPGGYGFIELGVGLLAAVGAFLGASGTGIGPGADRSILFASYLPAAWLGYSLLIAVILHSTRQLRLVARIHREATAIDPFDRGALYAFSNVTARTGLAYVIAGYYAVTVNGAFQAGNTIGIAVILATFAVGVSSFVLPLWGIHERLVREKANLTLDVERLLTKVGAQLYAKVDRGELDSAGPVNASLSGLLALRDRISRVPTWPWPPQLLRGFLSALLLPVVVYIVGHALSLVVTL